MHHKRTRRTLAQILPPALCLLLLVSFLLSGRSLTAAAVVTAVPENRELATLFCVILFAVKGMTVLIPLVVLYMAVGLLFSPVLAVLVNTAGLSVCLTLPYLVGRVSGHRMVRQLEARYPKLQDFMRMERENDWLVSFFLRIICCLPGDIVSMHLGALQIPFWPYLTGSLAGSFPGLLLWTLLSSGMVKQTSPGLILAAGAMAAAAGLLVWLYLHRRR